MSRSRKKTPKTGIASGSGMDRFKQMRAGQERARLRTAMTQMEPSADGSGLEVEMAPWDEWDSPRDGKQWLGGRWPREDADHLRRALAK